MKSAGKARSNGLYRHIRTSKEIIRNLLNDSFKAKIIDNPIGIDYTYFSKNGMKLLNCQIKIQC